MFSRNCEDRSGSFPDVGEVLRAASAGVTGKLAFTAFILLIDSAYISAAPAVAAGVSCTARIVTTAPSTRLVSWCVLTAMTVAALPMSVSVRLQLWSKYEVPTAAHAMPA